MELISLAKSVKEASFAIMNASTEVKNEALKTIASALQTHKQEILEANQIDISHAQAKHMPENRMDRMLLNEQRIDAIIEGVRQVAKLPDPIGEILNPHTLENGLKIAQMRVALGVVGMIYEARPNVTVDAAVLCLKAGNAVMLRGSKDILSSNKILVSIMQEALSSCGLPKECIALVEDTSHESAKAFMRLNDYLDVLIPRGGAALIQNCVENASVPLLETGTGNCHVYVDASADFTKATNIILNAKTQRTSVCNACESVLLHMDVIEEYAPTLIQELLDHGVRIHADVPLYAIDERVLPATQEDYEKEYLDMEISIKCVSSLNEAIYHINHFSTHHSETIVSEDRDSIMQFLQQVDSACVYANASTRFSDGFAFGLGAEIGISTQKLHARGPMGLEALTSLKYLIQGTGQTRP